MLFQTNFDFKLFYKPQGLWTITSALSEDYEGFMFIHFRNYPGPASLKLLHPKILKPIWSNSKLTCTFIFHCSSSGVLLQCQAESKSRKGKAPENKFHDRKKYNLLLNNYPAQSQSNSGISEITFLKLYFLLSS